MDRLLHIAVVVDTFPTLSETFVINHIVTLLQKGHKVSIFANRKGNGTRHQLVEEFSLLDITCYRLPVPSNRLSRYSTLFSLYVKYVSSFPGIVNRCINPLLFGMDAVNGNVLFNTIPFLGKGDFDIIHCHFGPAGYRMEQVLRARKISKPLFVSFHGYDVLPGIISRFNYKRLFRYASGIFVNSQFLQNRLLEIGAKRSEISIIPVGLLPEYFSKGDCPKPDDLITCIGVGRLIEVKGFEYTIRAFARVKEMAPEYKFMYIIIGEGPLEEKLKSLVKELGLQNEVIFKGALPQQEVFRILSGSDVFILTGVKASDSAAETQGLVYQEAALFGIPVIGSKLGGVPETIQDNVTGLLATPGDIEEIAEKLVMLFSLPHLRKSMGENGSRNALNNFNQHLLTDKLLDRYKLSLKV